MRRIGWIAVALGIVMLAGVPSAPAQFIRDHEAEGGVRGFHGARSAGKITRSFQSDAEADAEFKRILSAVGLGYVADRITLRATAQTPNAEAFIDDKTGERFIFYNASFMQEVKQRGADDWSPISILAHEVGHHLAFHTTITGNNHKFELEADYFSGFVLRRLGATLGQAQGAMRAISPKAPGPTHPGLDDRLQVITIGWKDGGASGAPPGLKEAKQPVVGAQTAATENRSTAAEAHQFPGGKSIEMTTLFGAASASTQVARILADGMGKVLGATVPVLDKPGAGGATGYMHLSQQKPDGHSILWSSNSISTTFHAGQLPFDYKNFEHVARVIVENPVLAVKANAPWKMLKDLVEYAKANPDKVRVGNSGQGSQTHIASVALFSSVGAKVVSVHRTAGQATLDLLAGHIEVVVQFPYFVVPHVKSGDLRVLALLSSVPDPVFPDVKSAKAHGYNIDMPLWRGIFAPKGTPKAVIAKLQDAVKKTVESPEFKDAGNKIGFTPAYQPADAFTKMIADGDAVTAATMRRIWESESR
jgi:putative tricarboxylic transport membrane protein